MAELEEFDIKKARKYARTFALIVFIYFYGYMLFGSIRRFFKGIYVLEKKETLGWRLMFHGEEVPLVEPVFGPSGFFVLLPSIIAALIYFFVVRMDYRYAEEYVADHWGKKKKSNA